MTANELKLDSAHSKALDGFFNGALYQGEIVTFLWNHIGIVKRQSSMQFPKKLKTS